MINKTIFQGLIIGVAFFGLWFGLTQVNFVKFFEIEKRTTSAENKIGDLIWDDIQQTGEVVTNDTIVKTLDKLINPICKANGIERDSLKIHILKKAEINAFALPNNHLVVYTGLITDCKKQEALQGVLGHEIAHIENNHVMKKLSKEVGLSVLLAAASGGKGGQIVKEVFKTLSSTAYDRALEKEADMQSVKYLLKADINPEPMADFMYELAQKHDIPSGFGWISTHPESEERAKYILDYLKGKKFQKKQILTQKEWDDYKKQVENY
ncbi:M48 family metallopeptidase [Flavobacterium sp. SUN052]|uniref:M48 family metallopeptidase n=1 Tax=Flavobacterium sp. SUN052 TaxID=3002441 RepID=UPI00237E3886|nr:M48 family metallopeptidase [Flavobacterium sp. SUN052]MEC4003349.1 M48 family metallopeptidase [Flavobacterium sp. SUN052]